MIMAYELRDLLGTKQTFQPSQGRYSFVPYSPWMTGGLATA